MKLDQIIQISFVTSQIGSRLPLISLLGALMLACF